MSWSGFKKAANRATTQISMKVGSVERTDDSAFRVEDEKFKLWVANFTLYRSRLELGDHSEGGRQVTRVRWIIVIVSWPPEMGLEWSRWGTLRCLVTLKRCVNKLGGARTGVLEIKGVLCVAQSLNSFVPIKDSLCWPPSISRIEPESRRILKRFTKKRKLTWTQFDPFQLLRLESVPLSTCSSVQTQGKQLWVQMLTREP